MEKVPDSTTLFEFVMSNSPLPNTELLRHLFRELVSLNLTLKLFGIWHRDCKPENILYCRRDRTLRFIDFGSAAPVQSDDFREFQVSGVHRNAVQEHRPLTLRCLGDVGNHGTRVDSPETIRW